MTGGGFGGSAIVLVESAAADRVADAISAEFARRRFSPPRVMRPGVDGGARRER